MVVTSENCNRSALAGPRSLDSRAGCGVEPLPVTGSAQTLLTPHTIVALVRDQPGVLHRILDVWASKGFNIRSLAVGASERPGHSRMTFVVDASLDAANMVAEIQNLEEVAEIHDISAEEFVNRELALIRVRGGKDVRKQMMDVVESFGAKIVDVAPDSLIIEATGHEHKIDSLVRMLEAHEVVEMVRTGRVSMLRRPR